TGRSPGSWRSRGPSRASAAPPRAPRSPSSSSAPLRSPPSSVQNHVDGDPGRVRDPNGALRPRRVDLRGARRPGRARAGRVPAHARDVRHRRDGDHDAGRRAGAWDDGERVQVGLLRPPLILISVDRRARMNSLLREDARFGVSVLEEHQAALSDRFAGRVGTGPEPAFELVNDTPLVGGALAHLVARVVRSYWGGDHSLFLGAVEYVRYGE